MNRFQGCRVLRLGSVRKKSGTVWGEAVLLSMGGVGKMVLAMLGGDVAGS